MNRPLSFDSRGINGPDQYRTRICTFVDPDSLEARKYGPMMAAAPEMLLSLRDLLDAAPGPETDAHKNARALLAKFEE